MTLKADIAAAAAEGNLARLKDLGVPLKKAISLCEAAAKNSSKKNPSSNSVPAVAPANVTEIAPETERAGHRKPNSLPFQEPAPPFHLIREPAPQPPKQMGIVGMDIPHIAAPRPQPAPAAPAEPEPEWVHANKLHELSIHCESGYSSPDDLTSVGFSKSTAEEVSRAINAARCGYGLQESQVPLTAAAVAARINRVMRKEILK
jgi:hypothetical protein